MANEVAQLASYFGACLMSSGIGVLNRVPQTLHRNLGATKRVPVINGLPSRRTTICGVSLPSFPLVLHSAQSGQAEPSASVG